MVLLIAGFLDNNNCVYIIEAERLMQQLLYQKYNKDAWKNSFVYTLKIQEFFSFF